MRFPTMGNIATTSVVKVDIDETLQTALSVMLDHDHRNIIVVDEYDFRILTVIDIINIQKNKIDLDTKLSQLNLAKLPTISKEKNVLETVEYLNNSLEYICVINDDGSLYGLVTHTDITSNIDPDTLMENFRLNDFLLLGSKTKKVTKDEKISNIFKMMETEIFDNIIVLEDLKPIGILTTKDILKLIKNKSDLNKSISYYMSSPVDTLDKTLSIKDALNFIKQKHYKRVIVVDEKGNLAGVITQKELITLSYSKWATIMKEYQNELNEINNLLVKKTKKYEMIASTDSLTGLYNRRKFSELFISTKNSMLEREKSLSLFILDVDFFKKVNDNFGHNIGDKVLVQIAHSILRNLREIDIVCRWGGEEFVALLPTASLEVTKVVAQKLRKSIEMMEIDVVGKVTVSFGISDVTDTDDLKSAIEKADKALYLAKSSGRNCVKTYDDIKSQKSYNTLYEKLQTDYKEEVC